jgi:hypothetical protein
MTERNMKSKYLIVGIGGMEVPLVFSPFLQHEDVALAVRNPVHSAGFCELDSTGKWITSGKSVSLELDARQNDAAILNEHLGAGSGQVPCHPSPTAFQNAKH